MIEKSKVRLYNSNDIVDCDVLGSRTLFKDTHKEVRKVYISYEDPVNNQFKKAVYPKSRIKLSSYDKKNWGWVVEKCVL